MKSSEWRGSSSQHTGSILEVLQGNPVPQCKSTARSLQNNLLGVALPLRQLLSHVYPPLLGLALSPHIPKTLPSCRHGSVGGWQWLCRHSGKKCHGVKSPTLYIKFRGFMLIISPYPFNKHFCSSITNIWLSTSRCGV